MEESSSSTMRNLTLTSAASNISEVPSPGFDSEMLGYQLKSTSGDPSLDLGINTVDFHSIPHSGPC